MIDEPELPPGYRLDMRQADFLFLLRQDDSQVAVFNAWSASAEHIRAAADEDLKRRSPSRKVADTNGA